MLAGCGSSARGGPGVSSPFTEQHAELFDDGVDLLENPDALDGRWQEDWSLDFDKRLSEADVVVMGNVQTLRTDVDLDQRQSFRLALEVERTVKGAFPSPEVSLVARENAAGYATLDRNKEHLLDQRFVVFVKYAEEEGQVVGHFHLVPPSRAVLERLQAFEQGRKPRNVTVITHSN
jgi:hypothetical protein